MVAASVHTDTSRCRMCSEALMKKDKDQYLPIRVANQLSEVLGYVAKPNDTRSLYVIDRGVSAQSFVQAFNLTHTNFSIQLASPGGKVTEFVQQDESNRRWLNDFRTKSYSNPISLESIDGFLTLPTAARYSALLIPAAPGALHDLATNQHLAQIVSHFAKENKPVCAIGPGVAGLCSAKQDDGKTWSFADYSMTAPSIFELARTPEFASLPILLEDFVKDNGGKYSSSECDAVHIIVDRHLVTGQNAQSTLIAVQNLILLCTHKQTKHGGGR